MHLLLTRFNVKHLEMYDTEPRGLDPDWLDHRLPWFERMCAPSVAGQSVRRFRWLVFVHPDTPQPYRSRIVNAVADRGEVVWSTTGAADDVLGVADARSGETLTTTRLDNDDALARDFMARVQAVCQDAPRFMVNLRRGAQIGTDGVVRATRHDQNPFLTLVERGDPETVWAFDHSHAPDVPKVQLGGRPGWLVAIHGRNLGNPKRAGRQMRKRTVLASFAVDPELVVDRTAVQVAGGLVREGAGVVARRLRDPSAFLTGRPVRR